MTDRDDHDDLSALDFSDHDRPRDDDGSGYDGYDGYGGADSADRADSAVGADAFDFSPADGADDSANEADALGTDALGTEALGTEAPPDADDPLAPFTHSVTNPPGTVTVSAAIDGSIRSVDIAPTLAPMTERALAEEILVIASLARDQALAAQRTMINEAMVAPDLSAFGLDGQDLMGDILDAGLALPTPEQAGAAKAEVFATRYAVDE